jgi:hypothetical protein
LRLAQHRDEAVDSDVGMADGEEIVVRHGESLMDGAGDFMAARAQL